MVDETRTRQQVVDSAERERRERRRICAEKKYRRSPVQTDHTLPGVDRKSESTVRPRKLLASNFKTSNRARDAVTPLVLGKLTCGKWYILMSTTDTPEIPDYTDDDTREEVLADLEDAMGEALRKFTDGRVRDAENEKVRQGWLRAYTSAVAEYRRLVDDLEQSEQEQRIERLESLVEELDSDGST